MRVIVFSLVRMGENQDAWWRGGASDFDMQNMAKAVLAKSGVKTETEMEMGATWCSIYDSGACCPVRGAVTVLCSEDEFTIHCRVNKDAYKGEPERETDRQRTPTETSRFIVWNRSLLALNWLYVRSYVSSRSL